MSGFHDQIADAVSAVDILSHTRHSWLGEPSESLPEHVVATLSEDDARGFLVFSLVRRLYADYYCLGRAGVSQSRARTEDTRGDPALVEALGRANAGTGCWERGWTLRGNDGGQVVVERDGLTVWALAEECRSLADDRAGADGSPVTVRFPKELVKISPGFYMALADRPLELDRWILRLYWNVRLEGAVAFVAQVTRLMKEAGLGSRMKVANHPALFDRCDAGVLYLHTDEAVAAAEGLGALRHALAGFLDPAVPALTRQVAPGIGLAVDPGGGESFGFHRCNLIAEGLVRAHEDGIEGVEDRVEAVRARFSEAGVDPDAPYLPERSANRESKAIDELAAAIGG